MYGIFQRPPLLSPPRPVPSHPVPSRPRFLACPACPNAWQHNAQCKTRRSRFNKRCRDLGHDQKGVKATLRFFECTNCRKRCSSTERVPRTGCESCGRHDMWKRCGARPGRGPAEGPRDKRFVAALSEVGVAGWLGVGRRALNGSRDLLLLVAVVLAGWVAVARDVESRHPFFQATSPQMCR